MRISDWSSDVCSSDLWVCVSPKAGSEVVQREGDELKLVWPQDGIDPAALEGWDFRHFLIQPTDDPQAAANREAAIALVLARPRWRLSTQIGRASGRERVCK